MITIIPSVLAFISAAAHIHADRKGMHRYAYVFKPLTMALLLLIAVLAARDNLFVYGLAIIVGIVFSLVGDVAMMLPEKRIIIGMGAFLVAHVAYIISFSSGTTVITNVWPVLPFLIFALVMGLTVLPRAGKLKLPVEIYEMAIIVMAWRALERMLQTGNTGAMLAFASAVWANGPKGIDLGDMCEGFRYL